MATYRVLVLDEQDMHDWQVWSVDGTGVMVGNVAKVAASGEVPFRWLANGFEWMCPGCGVVRVGILGDVPIPGWDSPRWVNTGTDEGPTLLPSLSCPRWRNGICPDGHWWLRNGELVPA